MYTENGVTVDKTSLVEGKKAKLTYTGNLYQLGAEEIYIHLGYGLLWDELSELKMTKSDEGFTTEIPLSKADTLYFCFRDNTNNWDNNSYQNYAYEIGKKKPEKSYQEITSTVKINNTYSNLSSSNSTSSADYVPVCDTDTAYDLPNENIAQITAANVETLSKPVDMSSSLVLTPENEFTSFRKLSDNYIRNKKMRIMFYRVFAYVPRLLNGYAKRKARTMIKNNGILR